MSRSNLEEESYLTLLGTFNIYGSPSSKLMAPFLLLTHPVVTHPVARFHGQVRAYTQCVCVCACACVCIARYTCIQTDGRTDRQTDS